jgi:hypothetical protein
VGNAHHIMALVGIAHLRNISKIKYESYNQGDRAKKS